MVYFVGQFLDFGRLFWRGPFEDLDQEDGGEVRSKNTYETTHMVMGYFEDLSLKLLIKYVLRQLHA